MNSWIEVPEASDFPLENLPYGSAYIDGVQELVTRVGDHVVSVTELARDGWLDASGIASVLKASTNLDGVLARTRAEWTRLREVLTSLLAEDSALSTDPDRSRYLSPVAETHLAMPFTVRNYCDFYSSEAHATNMGRLFRPDGDPLLPQWRHIPMTYHGRPGTVVVSGTPVHRPAGPVNGPVVPGPPEYAICAQLDYEVELGFVVGSGSRMGTPVPISDAAEQLFGVVLLNDWSARDLQRYEYVPFGPFLGKSFATSISPWVVTWDALATLRVDSPKQNPPVMPYLRTEEPWNLDLVLTVELSTANVDAAVVSRVNPRDLYWNAAQCLAHTTVNGAVTEPGDLLGSGTISEFGDGGRGCLNEQTEGGRKTLTLDNGLQRTFLLDGDIVVIRGYGVGSDGVRIGFGEVSGTILERPEVPA